MKFLSKRQAAKIEAARERVKCEINALLAEADRRTAAVLPQGSMHYTRLFFINVDALWREKSKA